MHEENALSKLVGGIVIALISAAFVWYAVTYGLPVPH